MNLRYTYILISVLALFLNSCTAPFDINTKDSKPVIVIYGAITDEYRFQRVRITSSSPYFEDKNDEVIGNAIVKIEDSEGEVYQMKYIGDGYYESTMKFNVDENVTYNLTVEVDFDKDGDVDLYEAHTTVQPIVPVDSINLKYIEIMGYSHYALNLFMQDSPEQYNYYLFRYIINDSISNFRISELLTSSDELYNGSYLDNVTIIYFEDGNDEDNIKMNEKSDIKMKFVYPGDKITFQIINIEEGYYKFINECISEKNGENPFFGGPPSNITSNISNGGVGYFTGYRITRLMKNVPSGVFKTLF
jgi:hypothetical protein